jgi:hypothetical protein
MPCDILSTGNIALLIARAGKLVERRTDELAKAPPEKLRSQWGLDRARELRRLLGLLCELRDEHR